MQQKYRFLKLCIIKYFRYFKTFMKYNATFIMNTFLYFQKTEEKFTVKTCFAKNESFLTYKEVCSLIRDTEVTLW